MGVLAVEEQLHARYGERTARSRALYERALGTLPGGDTRTGTFFLPYPIFTERGQDCRLFDVDGNEYLDFLNNFTSLVHGHAHPNITAAIAEQAAKGTVYATPVEIPPPPAGPCGGTLATGPVDGAHPLREFGYGSSHERDTRGSSVHRTPEAPQDGRRLSRHLRPC